MKIYIVTTTKPADVAWMHLAMPHWAEQYKAWMESFPGFISKSGRELDHSTWENTFVFESEEAWKSFNKEKLSFEFFKEISSYNKSRGITTTTVSV
jgi:hypothetical protein